MQQPLGFPLPSDTPESTRSAFSGWPNASATSNYVGSSKAHSHGDSPSDTEYAGVFQTQPVPFAKVLDGTNNTVAVGEAPGNTGTASGAAACKSSDRLRHRQRRRQHAAGFAGRYPESRCLQTGPERHLSAGRPRSVTTVASTAISASIPAAPISCCATGACGSSARRLRGVSTRRESRSIRAAARMPRRGRLSTRLGSESWPGPISRRSAASGKSRRRAPVRRAGFGRIIL